MDVQNPKIVFLHLTNACNLNCIHCYAKSSPNGKENELTTEEIFELLDNIHDYGVKHITFSGGEPLLRKDSLEIIKYAIQQNFFIHIETNGTLLNTDMLKMFKANNISLNISLDGINSETHDFIRGNKGAFSRTISNIKNGTGLDVNINVWCCVSNHNIKEALKMPKFLMKLGVKTLGFTKFLPVGRGSEHSDLCISPENWKDFCSEIESIRQRTKDSISIFYEVCFLDQKELAMFKMDENLCYATHGKNSQVTSTGDVIPCGLFLNTDIKLGNVRNAPFSDIWENSPMWKIFDDDNLCKECKMCKHFSFCRSGCRGFTLNCVGNTKEKDPRCKEGLIPICPLFILPKKHK